MTEPQPETTPAPSGASGRIVATLVGGLAAAVVLGFLGGAISLAAFGRPPAAMSQDERAIADVVRGVIAADKLALLPPSRDASGRVSAEVLQAMQQRMRGMADSLFAEPYRSDWVRRMDTAIVEQGAGNPILAGGVRESSRWRIRIDGDQATATLRAVTYLDTLPSDGQPGIHPVNTADYELELVKIHAAWLVATWSFEFTPGGGP